jgi:twitching motility protein PilT
VTRELAAVRIEELLAGGRARGASDVHFGGRARAALRIDGRLRVLDEEALTDAEVAEFLAARFSPETLGELAEHGSATAAGRAPNIGPHRIHAYRQTGGVRVVVRLLAQAVPQLADLGLPPTIASFAQAPLGLVLFTGPTGSGKTTALAALIDRINREGERNIVTVEDPIEYVHTPIRSIVTQCEIGRDVADFARALRDALREDPDVLLVGEMRDPETIGLALTAAETGHLVFATLHTNDTAQTIDRIIDAFPSEAQAQIRAQLAAVLLATVGLRLVPRSRGSGRRAAAELLVATDAVRNLIREGKTHQLRNAIVTGRGAGMQTLEAHLSELVARREIALDAARSVTNRPHDVREPERGVA